MIKSKFLILLLSLNISVLSGCGIEVVETDLPEGEAKLVVEGSITNKPGIQVVKLSRTTGINRSVPVFEPNAKVEITDSEGNTSELTYSGNGKYTSRLTGVPGLTYHLKIDIDGVKYYAESQMPETAQIDSVSYSYYDESMIREEGYYISLHNLDSGEKESYYRWMVWVNDTLQGSANGIPGYFATHQLNINNTPLSLQYPEAFQKGDRVRIETIKMDKTIFNYYQGVLELIINDGGLLGPVPVNPVGNISGNSIGIFQAVSITETGMIIK